MHIVKKSMIYLPLRMCEFKVNMFPAGAVAGYAGQVTRIAVRWAPTDIPTTAAAQDLHFPFDPSGDGFKFNYVWHCHIIDHEDNEMMRPDLIQPALAFRQLIKGVNY